ncbi:MAG: alcohol dehydrogenase catalytic domain-containing protein, partial [Candidatus Aminicenantes bacterium]|nr:alcohol dehydrogenase catalytic domain-containing protein [Candidatus Aminicenantes bacterium]
MRALGMYEGGRLELEETSIPQPPPGWGLVRSIASAAGLFQAQMLSGMLPTDGYPRILGHEIVGEVAQVTSDAAPPEGSMVVVDAVVGCSVCEWCITGDDMICPWMRHLGINIDGGFADYVAVPESHMFPIKPGTPVEEAVMLGSALPASVHAARRAGIRGGHQVVVTGVGSIGLTICQVARAMGATTVVAVDIADDRLDAATPWTDGVVNVSGVEPEEAAHLVREAL